MANFNVGFVIFPELTQLDFTGPLQVLARLPDSTVHIAAKTLAPVPSDCGLGLVPTTSFADCPPLDLICVPGGAAGVARAMVDEETVAFVRRQAQGAKYVTSVCTGAFILGVAGLLQRRRATTHWGYTELLPLMGATHEKARIRQGRQPHHRGRRHLGDRFRSPCRRGDRGRGGGPRHPARHRIRSGAALRFRPSRPRAGSHQGGPVGPLRGGDRKSVV